MSAVWTGNLLWLVAALVCGAGTFMLYAGLRTRRKGNESRCRRCEYELHGIASERCPECGNPLSPTTIVHGTKYRKPGLFVAGLFLLLSGAGFVALLASDDVRRIEWYQYSPTTWVIKDLKHPQPAERLRAWNEVARRIRNASLSSEQLAALADTSVAILSIPPPASRDEAWAELMRQDGAGSLTAAQRGRLIDLCIAEQGSATPALGWDKRIDWLADQFLDGRVSVAQREAFLGNLFKIDLVARAKVVRGDELPYSIRLNGRGPRGMLWYNQQRGVAMIDDVRMPDHNFASRGSGFSGNSTGSSLKLPKDLPIGAHTLRVANTFQLYRGKIPNGVDRDAPLWKSDVELEAKFELLDAAPADFVELVDDPTLGPTIRNSISVRDVTAPAYTGKGVSFMVDLRNLPIDCAFDVFALIGDGEFKIGTLTGHGNPNSGSGTHLSGGDFDSKGSKTICLILRSSETAARRTVDLTRIWKGEIRLDEIPVTPNNPPNAGPR